MRWRRIRCDEVLTTISRPRSTQITAEGHTAYERVVMSLENLRVVTAKDDPSIIITVHPRRKELP